MAPTQEASAAMSSLQSIGPEVVVKNTFIEVKVEEESTPLPRNQRPRRAKTQPQAGFDGITTEDEATDSDVSASNFMSEDGTSEPEEVVLAQAATDLLARSGGPPQATGAWQPVPQFGGGDLKVIVKNTFLDVDLATPSVRRVKRSITAPNKQSLSLADFGLTSTEEEAEHQRGCGATHKEAELAQEEEEEEEEVEPPVERIVTQDWYESPQAWEWVPGMRMPLEPGMVRPATGASTGLQAQTPKAQPAAPSGAQPSDASLSHAACLGAHTYDAKSVTAAPAKQDMAPEERRPQIQVQVPPFILEDVSLSDADSGFFRVHWTVDARKLRGNDKQVVSPPFELALGPNNSSVPFKMMIYPKVANSTRPGVSFKTSGGNGYIQLKCEAELSQSVAGVVLRLSLGDATAPRGPVPHNFLSSGVCGLPKGQEIWDFSTAVDQGTMTFCICLEIAPSKSS